MFSVTRNGFGGLLCHKTMVFVLAILLALASSPTPAADVTQTTFASPEAAVTALVTAARDNRRAELVRILGPAGVNLVRSGDPVADRYGREKFVAAYDEMHKIDADGEARTVLSIGKLDWPFPIPLVKREGTWRFDTKSGAQEILDRRIGANELNAIEVCRAYVDAQGEYAAQELSGSKLHEYAQRFMSSPGKRDGLFWPVAAGETESPMGPLVAQARAEGYGAKSNDTGKRRSPYHGYYYRILTKQGPHAIGGAYDYIVRGQMIGGFALVAFPAKYKDSGIMTFIVNHDGIVYQKNVGVRTATLARRMAMFDPDATWTRVK